jgi:glycosyltransferase involved in cell wall biosynthesis
VPETGKRQSHAPAGPRTAVLLVAPQAPPYGGMALQGSLLARLLREDGHSVVYFPSNLQFPKWLSFVDRVPGLRTAVRHLLTWWKLWKQVRSVEVVHVLAASWLYFFAVVAPATIVGKCRGKRVILNYRGGDADRFFRHWGRAARPIMQMADVITAPSQFLANLIRHYFGRPVTIVSNILDGSAFRFRERERIAPRLVVARQLEKIYDIESVLRAFGAIQKRYPNASLAVAGTGSEEKRLRALAGDWNLRNATFLGHVAHRDLPAIYDQYDIFLNASRVDNFPGALLEASAAGLVLVSTAPGGIPFMYEHGKNALLVTPGDWEGLARNVELVLESPALARQLALAGTDVVRSCEWAAVRESIYDTYGLPTRGARMQVSNA